MGANALVDRGPNLGQAVNAARRATDEAIGTVARTVVGTAVGIALEATYTAVGLGLLTVQRAQVRRREIERALRG